MPTLPKKQLGLVVAMNQDRVIGRGGALPWHFGEDLRHFKNVTMGHPLLMGRKTYDSIGRPLPGRPTIVISRNPELTIEGCKVAASFDEALTVARAEYDKMPMVVGGASAYQEALPVVTHLYLTEVDLKVENADTFFPSFDRSEFKQVKENAGQDPRLTFSEWERKDSSSALGH